MVNSRSADAFDQTFRALANPTRRAILERLTRGESTLGELARPFEMSMPAVLKHLRILEAAGLVHTRKQGRVRHCRLETKSLKRASRWIDSRRALWERRLEVLDTHLREEKLQ